MRRAIFVLCWLLAVILVWPFGLIGYLAAAVKCSFVYGYLRFIDGIYESERFFDRRKSPRGWK